MAELSGCNRIRLVLDVKPDVDPIELDAITSELRGRVLEVVEVHDAEGVPVRARERDVKAGGTFLPGQLDIMVPLAAPLAAVVLHEVFSTIRTYLRERPVVSVKIRRDGKGNLSDLEITGTTADVEALVRRCLEEPGEGEREHAG